MNAKTRLTPLASCLAAAFSVACPTAFAVDLHVSNCSNAGTGSLRAAVASAAITGDRVVFDTGAMNCSTITLTSGQIQIDAKELTLQGPTASTLSIDGNHASRVFRAAGPVGSPDPTRKLTINNLTIKNGLRTASSSTFFNAGGCIYSDGDLTLSSSTITGCNVTNTLGSALGGGAFANSLHIYNSVVTNNVASATAPPTSSGGNYNARGAGLEASGEVIIHASTISANHAIASGVRAFSLGGGLFLPATSDVSITASSITGNEAADRGGGVYLYADNTTSVNIVIDRSTISGNTSAFAGGASIVAGGSSLLVTNSTVSGNVSTNFIGGMVGYANPSTFINDTIAFNTAASDTLVGPYGTSIIPAGLYVASTLINTIVAHNTVAPGVESDFGASGVAVSGSNNLIMATIAGSTAPTGTLTADPMLGPLASNGGSTMTHALLVGSPAIDAGCASTLRTDQRGPGFPRIWGPTADIGSFEFGDPASGDIIFRSGFDENACPP